MNSASFILNDLLSKSPDLGEKLEIKLFSKENDQKIFTCIIHAKVVRKSYYPQDEFLEISLSGGEKPEIDSIFKDKETPNEIWEVSCQESRIPDTYAEVDILSP
ncbi:MAG TPA: hypothetical protein VKP03_03005 [Patescibacteria group bacterium]|nr:hypothetical protein [Patescibacteria group bacterium]